MTVLEDATSELAASGELDQLKALLAADPNAAKARNQGEETLLHIAARQWPKLTNGTDIARTLLEAGADVNAEDKDGLRPIHGATGDLELTRALLEAGADTAVYAVDHMNMSPAEVCLYYGLPDEARLMVEFGAPADLRVAAGIGDIGMVRGFLKPDGAFRQDAIGLPGQPGPKLTLDEGVTQALSYAARNGHTDMVAFLLDHGADIDALVPHFDVGCTPLHQAVSGGHPAVAELLIERGARQDIRDDGHKSTALEWAQHQEKADLAAILTGQ